jgi:hypothetical protein
LFIGNAKQHGRGGICFINKIDSTGKMLGNFHKYENGAFAVSDEIEIKRDAQRENSKEYLTERIVGALERVLSCVYKKHKKRPPEIDNSIDVLATDISTICKN